MSKSSHLTFSQHRQAEEAAFQQRRRELVEAAKRDPNMALYGRRDPELAAMLGGAVALHRFREVVKAHRLNPERKENFERARMLAESPDEERSILFREVAAEMHLDLKKRDEMRRVAAEVARRYPHVIPGGPRTYPRTWGTI